MCVLGYDIKGDFFFSLWITVKAHKVLVAGKKVEPTKCLDSDPGSTTSKLCDTAQIT